MEDKNISVPVNPPTSQPAKIADDEIFLEIKQTDALEDISKKRKFNLLGFYNKLNDWLIDHSSIKFEEKLLFFQLLVTMVNSGVSVPEALNLLYKQMDNIAFKRVISMLERRMNNGDSFADALSYFPNLFDEATCSIVRAGENSGKLTQVLQELVKQFERSNKVQKKAKSVMTYPIIIVCVMVVLLVVVMVVVVPKLEAIFDGAENLPTPTRIMIAMSDFFIHKWYVLVAGVLALGTSFILWKNSKMGKVQIGNILLRLPVISTFIQQMILSRVTRIMGFLISSGVPIIDSVTISADVAGNEAYRRKMILAAEDLGKGIEISENFADDERLFPSMMVRMMAIGEKTSSLGKVLGKLADYYDDELERRIGSISKLMEPVILMIMAVGAVFMILAVYLPILQMNEQVAA